MKQNATSSHQAIERHLGILKEVPERNPTAAQKGRAKFLEQARGMRASISGPVSAPKRFRPFSIQITPFRAVGWAVTAVLVVAFLFGMSVITVYASQGSLPGEGLYTLKIWTENRALSLPLSAETRLNLTLTFTDRRMEEVTHLQSAGRPIPTEVVNRFKDELDQSLELAAETQGSELVESLRTVTSHAAEQLETVNGLIREKANPPGLVMARARLQEQVDQGLRAQVDPEGFLLKFHGKYAHGKNPEQYLSKDPTFTWAPTETPTPKPSHTPRISHTPKPSHTPKDALPGRKGNPGSSEHATPTRK